MKEKEKFEEKGKKIVKIPNCQDFSACGSRIETKFMFANEHVLRGLKIEGLES
jgi:hypothetical protein